MQDDDVFMMSPMDASGAERLRRVRACIKQTFSPGGPGRRTKRALEMPAAAPSPAKTPRTKLRQRIEKAAEVSADELFFRQFGSEEDLLNEEIDLFRPSKPAARPAPVPTQPSGPISHFSFGTSRTATGFSSALPAPSTNTSQLTRPSRVRTPRKAAIKRARAGESSAEKALPTRKPRLGGISARTINYSSAVSTSFAAPAVDPRRTLSFVTKRGDELAGPPSYSSKFLSRTSPSKFQFSSNATRLFSQRQAPLR